MRKDISNTWEGEAKLVKGKDSYYVINYKPVINNRFVIDVYKSDDRGVVIDPDPVEKEPIDYYNETIFESFIEKYEYKIKKKKKSTSSKKKKESKKSKSKSKSKKKAKKKSKSKTKSKKNKSKKKSGSKSSNKSGSKG